MKRCKDCISYGKNLTACLIHIKAGGTARTCIRYAKTLKPIAHFKASTRKEHPQTSHEAEERVQEHVSEQACLVLVALRDFGPRTAGKLDKLMRTGPLIWNDPAHRRMKDLETARFVSREQRDGDHELTCTITDKGIAYLEGLK